MSLASPDLSVFQRIKAFPDYQKAEEEFQLAKQLKLAQMQHLQAQAQAAMQPDIEKLGQQAFIKAAQGIPLSSQEAASLQFLDAKSQTVVYNPVTGAREEKPSLLQRAGMQFEGQPATQQSQPPIMPRASAAQTAPMGNKEAGQMANLYTENNQPTNPWDAEFQQQYDSLAGNPKAQAELKLQYAKARMNPTEGQSNAALYADRMAEADPIIANTAKAVQNPKNVALGSIPLVGNYLVPDDYQSGQQAQRDFVNAVLRRESGAVISPSEFANAAKQYFPQAGDSPQVIAQKAKNRQTAMQGIQRAAGASYQPKKSSSTNIHWDDLQ